MMLQGPRSFRFTGVVGLVLALSLTACGSGSSSKDKTGLEKTTITVGYIPAPDFAALFVAKQKGFFQQEGLTVKPELEAGGATAVPKLASGSLDFSINNYVSAIEATSKGVGAEKVVADAYQLSSNCVVMMVPADSNIHKPQDLKGKKIAINTKANVTQLTTTAVLKPYGITIPDSDFVEVDYPQMINALKSHSVDAAVMIEPFVSASEEALGARMIVDMQAGTTADFPLSAYVTTQKFAKKNPKTVAAFQRAIDKAQQLVASDRKVVEQILPTYTKIDPKTASIIHIGRYPTSVSRTRIQRVADVMLQYGYLKTKFDAGSLL
jgi:NitT/TauT family transport system substrate-binding protein